MRPDGDTGPPDGDTGLPVEARLVLSYLTDQLPQATIDRDRLPRLTRRNDRTVRAAIHTLRAAGYPIWSDPRSSGYRLATSWHEVSELADRFEATGKQHLVTASRLRKRFHDTMPIDNPSQPTLWKEPPHDHR